MNKTIESMKYSIDAHFDGASEHDQYTMLDELGGTFDHFYELFKETQECDDFAKAMWSAGEYWNCALTGDFDPEVLAL